MNASRIKEVAKGKNLSLEDISSKLGISYVALYKKIKTSKFDTLTEIAEVLKCDVHELIDTGSDFSHFYDQQTGEWLGIRKK